MLRIKMLYAGIIWIELVGQKWHTLYKNKLTHIECVLSFLKNTCVQTVLRRYKLLQFYLLKKHEMKKNKKHKIYVIN